MKAKWFSVLSVVIILVLAIVPVAGASDGVIELDPLVPAPSAETGEMVDETPHSWFVEFASKPISEGGSKTLTDADKAKFRTAAAAKGIEFTERFAFNNLWNGVSINVSPADVNKLRTLPGVVAVYPVVKVSIPETTTSADPELFTAIQMTGADIAQNELGYTGAGVKVAVMDTGIDYDHPDLGGCFGPGCRVAYGYDFVGDTYNADDTSPSYNPIPSPDLDPDDCGGHGTHVAGIVGANGTVVGVAPGVTFGAYRVFGCVGSTDADIMVAAMERALADDMDILNMSIGSAFTWPQYPTAVAADRLVKKGMVVVASIGNSGANGLYSAGAPGLGKDVIGVASFDNTHNTASIFEVNGTDIGYLPMSFSGPVPTSGSAEIVYVGLACTANLPLLADPAGKTALAVRGTCSFGEKATNAINAGATAVVIANNAPGLFSGTLGAQIGDGSVPVVGIAQADGVFLRAQTAPVMMTWTDRIGSFLSPNGGLISSFSSYGLAPDLSLKPDIGAPGGNIYSTYPLEEGGYAVLGGTSMASPHVAGAAALLLEAKPHTKARDVRGILQNSADPKNWWGNPALGFLDNVHRQGAGMVDIDDAIKATTVITPSKIATGEYWHVMDPAWVQPMDIRNNSNKPVTYDITYVNALSTGGVITPSFFTSDAYVEFSESTITVPQYNKYTIEAYIHAATTPVNGIYGGYIVFTPRDGGQVYRVPYAGFVGDYQGIQALTPTPNGFPWLALSFGGSFYGPVAGPEDWVYSMEGEDVPWILVHFDHQVAEFYMEIYKANGQLINRKVNLAHLETYLPRNSTTTSFFAFPWDGTRRNAKGNIVVEVPDGQYYLVVGALKANGDPGNPAHWETWTSPIIEIDRP
jgi:subtilisin family serine protease